MSDEREDEKRELERLRAENAKLKAKDGRSEKRQLKGGFFRRLVVWVLIILGCIFAFSGVLSTWVTTTTLDTNTFVGTVGPLVTNPKVAKAVSDVAAKQLFEQYDVSGKLTSGLNKLDNAIAQALPPNVKLPDINLSAIAAPIANGLQTVASTAAEKILTSSAFKTAWEKSLSLAHQAIINIIRGNKNAAVTSQGDKVILNLAPLLNQIKDQLVASGLGFLSGVKVPENFGQFELFEAKKLGALKGIVHLLDVLYWLLPLLALLCFIGAVWISKNHRKALMGVGIGLAIVMLLILIALKVTHSQLFTQIKNPDVLAAADVVWGGLLHGLKQAVWGVLFLGVVVSVGAGVAGPSKWATWLRKQVSEFFKNRRDRREGLKGQSKFSEFIATYAWWIRGVGLGLAVIVLAILPHISVLAIIILVVVLAVWMGLIELFR